MLDFVTNNELAVRLLSFLLVLMTFILMETVFPKRPIKLRKIRWLNNFSLVAFNSLTLRIVAFLIAIDAATFASSHKLGLFNLIETNIVATVILSIILLDLAIYWQHRLMHIIPVFWRLHQVHHSDIEYDISTGLRFHPVEIILSYLFKYLLVLLIGAPMVAIIIFEIILNATAMFNHSNLRIPVKVDKILRLFIVTPDMHRVHHSINRKETDSNFGFNIPLWDYIFKSYTAQPKDGHQNMLIGVDKFRSTKQQQLVQLLTQPIRNE